MPATLSTHVLDTARGVPAAGIAVRLFALDGDERRLFTAAETNADGRTDAPLGTSLAPGTYELVFEVAQYFARSGTPAFFDLIPVRFTVAEDVPRYHVPLLLSPWSYSTYRGS
jgi:5-hydroxyisourate hydrolase